MSSLDGASIGARVKEVREQKSWSQRMLGYKAGVSYSYVSHLEAGQYPRPGFDMLGKIAGAFGMTLHELLGVTESEALPVGDPDGLLRDLSTLPADVQTNLAALIRSLAASYKGPGGTGQGVSIVEAGGDNGR